MVFISSDGQLSSNRSWSISSISDIFWGILNFFVLFFQTLFNPDLTKRGSNYESSSYRPGGGRGPPPPPSRRMGGFFRRGGGGVMPPPAPMGGG